MKRSTGIALVGGALVGALAASVVGTVRRHEAQSEASPLRTLDRPDGEQLLVETSDRARLATVTNGSGPTIVLGHGWTSDMRSWRLVADRLVAAGWRVVSWDQRGHGDSTVGTEGFGVDQLGDDLAAVLNGLNLRGAIVAGHSMGGIGAQSFALRHPEVLADRVRGLVLVGTLGRSVPTLPFPMIQSVLTSDGYERRKGSSSLLNRYLSLRAFGDDVAPSVVERNREIFLDCPTSTVLGALEPILDFDLTGRLPTIDVPTLVLHGNRDRVVPLSRGQELERLIPDARLETLRGAGHMLPLERPDGILHHLERFSAELGAAHRVG